MTDADVKEAPRKRNPNRRFKPQGNLRRFWGCKDSEVLLEGPAGTGKTRCALEKAYLMAMKYPGSRILLARKTRESMTQTVLQIFEEWVVPEGSYLLQGPSRKMRESYTLKNGSELVVAGLDKPEKIMSAEYDAVFAFEATELTEKDFEFLTSRMDRRVGVIPYSQIVCDCNPDAPNHWLNRRASKGTMTRIPTTHRDNPVFFDIKLGKYTEQGERYINNRLRRLTGVRRQRLLEGKWVVAEGAVYPEFSMEKHVITREAFEKKPWRDWRKVRAIDFGFQNPFVCLWGALDPDGDLYVFREIYMTKRIVAEHASGVWETDPDTGEKTLLHKGIKQLSDGDGNVEMTVADHDREDRATLDKEGIDSAPAFKEIEPGIEAVKRRLQDSMHSDGQLRPRVYFVVDMRVEHDEDLEEEKLPASTLDEFANYRYPKPPKQDSEKSLKEVPIDKDNHGMDALRYLICYADDIGGTQIEVYAEAPVIVDNPRLRQF